MSVLFNVFDVGLSHNVGSFREMIKDYFPTEKISSNVNPDRVGGVDGGVEHVHRRSVEQ